MRSLILASGFGTRLYALGITKAKGLIEYKGKPLVSHIVEKIPKDFQVLLNTNKRFEADFRRWQNTVERTVTLCIEPVFTENESLGAVGSLNYWIKMKDIRDDLLVIASDNFFEFSLQRFVEAYDGRHVLVAVYSGAKVTESDKYGIVRLNGRRIVSFAEKPVGPASGYIATACYILPSRIYPVIREYCSQGKRDNLGNFVAHLVSTDEVHAYAFSDLWFDIGDPEVFRLIQKKGDLRK